MKCETVDELAGAVALGALPVDEAAAVEAHLASCPRDHSEIRRLIEAVDLLPFALDPVPPSRALRARIMATITTEMSPNALQNVPAGGTSGLGPVGTLRSGTARPADAGWMDHLRRGIASLGRHPSRLAAGLAMAAAIALGFWSVSTQTRLAEADQALSAIAAADALHRVHGEAGTGWLIVTDDRAMFLAARLAPLAPGKLYEFWLIDKSGTPIPAGTMDRPSERTVVPVEGSLGNAVAFAVTIEAHRVDRPSSEPVLTAQLTASSTP